MDSLFRSEEVQLSQLFLHIDSAYMCISELGELGLVQFRDSVPEVNAFQRKFVNEIRRCEEMERKLRFLETEIKKDNYAIADTGENPEAPAPREMIDLEANFEKLENGLKEVNSNAEQLRKTFSELTELKFILRKTQTFFDGGDELDLQRVVQGVVEVKKVETTTIFSFVAGVILREHLPAFERMLWRACRGNVFLKQTEIELPLEDPITGDKVFKSVFIIFFQGEQLRSRVKKICEGFHAVIYPCPDNAENRREMAISVVGKTGDLETVLNQTRQHRQRVLETAARNLRVWFIKVRKIKAIYHTLDLFNLDVTTKCMIGECWCAVSDLDKIHMALRRGMERSNSTLQPILNGLTTNESPPTYHRTNRFTTAFQTIVDAYGVAKYREVNPALFTIITFPFLFAVMFGDAGHGLLMFLFALWMVLFERKLLAQKSNNEIWTMFFSGRYLILLMGLFSIYTGMIYNDIFSRSANIFGSSWRPDYDASALESNDILQLEPRTSNVTNDRMFAGYPYAFGLDPIWQLSKNKIGFTNSIKMKMSIILGVIHMLFGLSLSFFNHKFYGDRLAIWCEFIPQMIFLTSIFGYLVLLMFYKWLAYGAEQSKSAPSLLLTLINMVRFSYTSKGEFDPSAPFYAGQEGLQSFLVILALICVPWMLFTKPLILRRQHMQRNSPQRFLRFPVDPNSNGMHGDSSSGSSHPYYMEEGLTNAGLDGDHGNGDIHDADAISNNNSFSQLSQKNATSGGHHENEKFDFGETMVHQAIHTIEYCLGCVSNTASYLRLWALSLAHAQLSEVLWSMVMHPGLNKDGYVGCIFIFVTFAFWACLTVAILLIMEGLSAFLHALRLHWVEFQNKFYSGTGYLFVPFSFEGYVNALD